MGPERTRGPDLADYMETRLNLLSKMVETMEITISGRIKESDIRYQQRFEAQEESIKKANSAIEERLKSVNEFRQVLSDQANSFMPRAEAMQALNSLSEKIGMVENRLNTRDGRTFGSRENVQDSRASIGTWIAVAAVIMSAVAVFFKFK